MKKILFLLAIISLLSTRIFAIDLNSLKKYPHQLLTDDYGILNEDNLKRYADNIISKSFKWEITGFDYWQCFPTNKVTVWYKKGEYDFEEKVIMGDPHITVRISPEIIHDYEPRRRFSLDYAKEKVMIWKRLMKNQKHVCIGGAFAGTYENIVNGRQIIEHGWIFENLKTQKGCDSYFSGWCN